MNKRWMMAILALLLVAVAASPAMAAGAAGQKRTENQNQDGVGAGQDTLPGKPVFALTGTVTALGADSITVLVYNGNRFVKPYFGKELVVLVREKTRYWQWTPDGCIPISLGDVQVGDTTSMRGIVWDNTFTAVRVVIDVPCCTP